MYILNVIVKQLYVLVNHKVFIILDKINISVKSSHKKRGALKAPRLFPDFS